MKELFVNGLTDESYIGKNIFDDKFGKIDKKSAGAPAEKPADATVDDSFKMQIDTLLGNYEKMHDMTYIQDYFKLSGSEAQTKIINYLRDRGKNELANALENSIKTE